MNAHDKIDLPPQPAEPVRVPSDDVLADALSNLEHDNYEQSYSGYKNRQADIGLIRAAIVEADRKRRGEPVAWSLRFRHGDKYERVGPVNYMTTFGSKEDADTYANRVARDLDGNPEPERRPVVVPLYVAPPAGHQPTPDEPSQEPGVPEGWKLVPVEPTREMVTAGKHTIKGADTTFESILAAAAYSSMLAAAPTPPAAPAVPQEAPSVEPSGYAYRYPDGGVRFSGGGEINGSKPTEAIPYWFSAPAQPKTSGNSGELPEALIPAEPDLDYLRSMVAGDNLPATLRGNILAAVRRIEADRPSGQPRAIA